MRVLLIVGTALFGLQLLAVAAFLWIARPVGPGPAPDTVASQIAAVVVLLDATPDPAAQARILAAAGGGAAGFAIEPAMPRSAPHGLLRPAELLRLKLAAQGLTPPVAVEDPGTPAGRLVIWVGLADGRALHVQLGEGPTLRVLDIPVGFLAGGAGLLVALVAVLAVLREMRPLRRLAARVARDEDPARAAPIAETGAPELRVLIGAINRMRARNAELIAGRTLALAAISHDLRTYLTRLRLRLEMMPEHPQRARAVADMDEMQSLMDATIAFIGGDAEGRATAEPGECDPQPVLAERAALHGAEPAEMPADLPRIPLSAADFGRVLDNLLENARRYGGGGALAAALCREGPCAGGLCVSVADRGPGIPAAERARVLEPFVRLEVSRSRELGGAGLGLAIVARLVRGAGGQIALEDRPGGGLLVRLLLPPV